MNNHVYRYLALLVLLFSGTCLAGSPNVSFGEAAQNVFTPTEIFTKLMLFGCYVLGTILIVMAFTQYRIHRQSPKLTPLTTPILLFILGVICVLIPYTSKIFGDSFSAVEQAKREGRHEVERVLSLPTPNKKKGLLLPIGKGDQNAEEGEEEPSDTEGSGHWTNDPHFNQ